MDSAAASVATLRRLFATTVDVFFPSANSSETLMFKRSPIICSLS